MEKSWRERVRMLKDFLQPAAKNGKPGWTLWTCRQRTSRLACKTQHRHHRHCKIRSFLPLDKLTDKRVKYSNVYNDHD